MNLFTGSGVALITPFNQGKVDFDTLTELVMWHLEMGTDALIIAGTTGESATLSHQEKLAVFEHVVELVDGRIPVIAGTGSNNTAESVTLSLEAEKVGVDGLLLVTPYYNKPTQRGLYAHFKAIADAVKIPVILYNVPGRTGVDLRPETVIELAKLPNVCGLKEASGDTARLDEIIACTKPDFAVYAGNDSEIYAVMVKGGFGVISVLANLLPRETHEIVASFLSGHKDRARELQLYYQRLVDALFMESNPVPVKTALNLLGKKAGEFRLPLVGMEEENLRRLKETLIEYRLMEREATV